MLFGEVMLLTDGKNYILENPAKDESLTIPKEQLVKLAAFIMNDE